MLRRLGPTLLKRNPYGDNLLHEAVRYGSLGQIKALLTDQDPLLSSELAKETNDHNCLPYDVIEESALDYDEKSEASALLFPYMKRHHLGKLSQPINIDLIVNSYYPGCEPKLLDKLKFVCDIANETRSLLPESETHPQTNDYPMEKKLAVRNLIKAMRKSVKEAEQSYPKEAKPDWVSITADIAAHYGAGNCREFSCVTLEKIRRLYKGQSEICYFEHDDHAFVVLDRGEGEVKHYKNWHPQSLICDSWGGGVYLGSEIEDRLCSSRYYTLDNFTFSTVILPFNPLFHRLASKSDTLVMDRVGLFASKQDKESVAKPSVDLQPYMSNSVGLI